MRLFFALWPDPPVREALTTIALACRSECRGRAMPAANLHATLAFLGEVESRRVAQLADIGAAVGSAPFEWVLDRLGAFRRNRIVFAGASRMPGPLSALAADLAARLAFADFRTEARAYVPHVTLLRDARGAPGVTTMPPLLWQVRHIVLVESVRGGDGQVYRPLQRFMLGR